MNLLAELRCQHACNVWEQYVDMFLGHSLSWEYRELGDIQLMFDAALCGSDWCISFLTLYGLMSVFSKVVNCCHVAGYPSRHGNCPWNQITIAVKYILCKNGEAKQYMFAHMGGSSRDSFGGSLYLFKSWHENRFVNWNSTKLSDFCVCICIR